MSTNSVAEHEQPRRVMSVCHGFLVSLSRDGCGCLRHPRTAHIRRHAYFSKVGWTVEYCSDKAPRTLAPALPAFTIHLFYRRSCVFVHASRHELTANMHPSSWIPIIFANSTSREVCVFHNMCVVLKVAPLYSLSLLAHEPLPCSPPGTPYGSAVSQNTMVVAWFGLPLIEIVVVEGAVR